MTTPHPPLPASLVEDLVRLLADALMADLTQFPHVAALDKTPASVASTQGIVRKIWFVKFWNEIDRSHEARR